MKANLNLDFIRGVLFSYAAYNLFTLLYAFCFGVFFPGALGAIGIISSIVTTAIYAGITFALLFTPTGHARFVAIFFGIILITQMVTVIAWSQLTPLGSPSPFNRYMIFQFLIAAAFVGLSVLYYRAFKNKMV